MEGRPEKHKGPHIWMGGGDPRYNCNDLPRAPRSGFLEQPQRLLRLPLLHGALGVCVLRCRPLLTPVVAALGRGSGPLVDGMLGSLLLFGLRPLGHRRDLLRQRGQVMAVEGLDVRV